jgi:hypothetical protein
VTSVVDGEEYTINMRYILIVPDLVEVKQAVPLHTMEALGGRESIAPTHSRPWHKIGVSGQCHAPAALYPWGKDPWYPLDRRLDGPQSWYGRRG